jgi:plastocyanin
VNRRRHLSAATVLVAVLATTTACGDDGPSTDEPEVIQVTVEGDTVTPSGDRIEVGVGQPVDIVVTSDTPGELHVHSSPETTEEFEAGENDPVKLQFDRPGIVDIELHEPFEGPVVSLEIS